MEFGFWSVVPPLLTIVLALVTKNVFVSLLLGILCGSMVMCGGDIFGGVNEAFYSFIHTFESNGNTVVLISFLLIGALIHLIEISGGIDGFTEVMLKKQALIKSERGACFFTWVLGIVIFTSGSLSCMVTGSVARPVNDALKVPHEKAAFLIHSTSTPWCVLLPLSGWLAAMTGYFTSGGVAEGEAISMLLKSIPLNFYCILAVFGALAVSLFNINIGPMKKAEKRVQETGELDEPGHGTQLQSGSDKVANVKPRAKNMLVPMGVLILGILGVLMITGGGNPTKGAGMQALLWGCILAVLTMAIMCVAEKLYTVDGVVNEIFKGMSSMLSVAAILLLGFTMGNMVKSLDTGNYLTSVFMGVLTPALLPFLTFLLCLLLSFATGTSMGTMAIMSVICFPMAINMGISVPLVGGALFGGSIFGDHCSPISDTTIMSSAGAQCEHVNHVTTQLPYAITVAALSFVSFVLAGFIQNWIICLAIGSVLTVATLFAIRNMEARKARFVD